jgi:hypothetical protein
MGSRSDNILGTVPGEASSVEVISGPRLAGPPGEGRRSRSRAADFETRPSRVATGPGKAASAELPEIRQRRRLVTPGAASLDLAPPRPLSCDDAVQHMGGCGSARNPRSLHTAEVTGSVPVTPTSHRRRSAPYTTDRCRLPGRRQAANRRRAHSARPAHGRECRPGRGCAVQGRAGLLVAHHRLHGIQRHPLGDQPGRKAMTKVMKLGHSTRPERASAGSHTRCRKFARSNGPHARCGTPAPPTQPGTWPD